ncbi:hypothetical protein WJX84_006812 [Apatococcus fuscideae]|uniref:Uncharacterized protein n=1 Tax=Apatococcus fuscideae TaxID=2026836 RepID=A0AAW1T5N2_9CHLO
MQTALASSPAATQLRPWQQQPAQLTRCTVRLSHSLASRPVKSVPCQALVAQGPEDDSDSDSPADSFSVGAFTRELEARGVVQSRSQEAQEAESFDGQQLLEVLLEKYERSYDLAFVQRRFAGKRFIALNILWHYKEQASFPFSEEQFAERLDCVAAALRDWGMVKHVKDQIQAQRHRPRMGKAISIMLQLNERTVQEWFS